MARDILGLHGDEVLPPLACQMNSLAVSVIGRMGGKPIGKLIAQLGCRAKSSLDGSDVINRVV